MFAFISTVQLALDSLDRLVDTLEERGTLSAVEAAQSLFATPSISDGLACSLLEEVTAGDSRVVCTGATVSLAGSRADPLLGGGRLRRVRPGDDRALGDSLPHLRARRRPRAGTRAGRLVSVARQSGRRPPGAGRAPDRAARAGAQVRSFRLQRAQAVPFLRGRGPPRRPQRPLRSTLPRTATAPSARAAPLRAAALHRRARPAAARGPAAPSRPRLARPVLRRLDEALPSSAARCRGDRRDPGAPDRARAGARS